MPRRSPLDSVMVQVLPLGVTHGLSDDDGKVLREGIARIIAVLHLNPSISAVHFDVVTSLPIAIAGEEVN